MPADHKSIMLRWDELKAERLQHESQWQQIADYFLPKSTLTIARGANELRSRKVTSSVPQTALQNCSALLMGYSIDWTRPFLKPNVEPGLVTAGRSTDLDAASLGYLDQLQWQVYDRMMLPATGFVSAAARVALELPAFGTGIQWIGRKRGFGPKFQARPLRACWIAENADAEVDTVYYAFRLPAWRVVKEYPAAAKVPKIAEMVADEKKAGTLVELLHVVEPRESGAVGKVNTLKPWADVVLAWEHNAVLQESGFDAFPYQVPRLGAEAGSPYGQGLAWQALPEAKVYNALQEMTELGIEQRVLPPTMMPANLFAGALDRRPGAANLYDTSALGFMSARDAFQTLNIAGDVTVGVEYMRELAGNIERALKVDWMRMLSNPNMTATQTMQIRDQQLRVMSSLIPGMDREWFGAGADRVLAVMAEEGMIAAPPQQLARMEVNWDYAGPLAIAQQQGQVDIVERLMIMQAKALEADPDSISVLNVDEGIRTVAEAMGALPGLLISREEMEARRDAKAQQRAAEETDRQAMAAATALRDAGQGVSSLQGAMGGGGGQELQPAA